MSETPEIGIICGNFDVLHPVLSKNVSRNRKKL